MRHRPLGRFLSAIFGVLALAAWSEVILVFFGSENPPTLVSLQLSIGLAAAATSWGSWRRARWAPIAAIAYGILTAILLLALPTLLELPAESRPGLRTGAAAVSLLAILSAAYFRSDARRSTEQISTERAYGRFSV